MKSSLVLANLLARPTRVLGSILGVALGVVLIVVTAGLARGMLEATGEREGAIGAEIVFQPPGSFGAGVVSTPLSLPVAYAEAIADIEGVASTTPVGRYIRSGARGIGFELIEGVVFDGPASYPGVTHVRIAEGRWPESENELVIDMQRAADYDMELGNSIEILGRDFRVTGIFEPEVGARIKMPLATLQSMLGAAEKCSWILVEVVTPEHQEAIAQRIDAQFPGNQIIFTRDIPGFYEQGIPSLTIFLRVVVGLATTISSLIILLAMYTSVTERTREIGILKALGASRKFIVTEIQKEAWFIGTIGIAVGMLLSLITRSVIDGSTSLIVTLELGWIALAASVALFASALGALYPAVKAAKQDPVEALAYE